MAAGDGKWGDPPQEVVDDAVDRAVTLVRACGGSMDSIAFGTAWKAAYPTYDRAIFKGTSVTSFTKLLQKYAQDELLVENTPKKEVKLYRLKNAQERERLEQSIQATMRTFEFLGELAGPAAAASGPWVLPGGLSRIGPQTTLRTDRLALPPDMAKYTKLSTLVDALEPIVLAVEKQVSSISAKEAVTALHHLKRLSWQAQYQVQRNQLNSIMGVFSDVASKKMDNLSTKSIALLVSALSNKEDSENVYNAASERLQQLASDALECEKQPVGERFANSTVAAVFSTQAVAVIVNSYAKTKRRDEMLLRSMSKIVMALPTSNFDAQAVAGIANGFASSDVRPYDQELFKRISTIARQLSPAAWTPYAVGLAVNAYDKIGALKGDMLCRLSQLTVAMLKGQRTTAFTDPNLMADMMLAFSKATCDCPEDSGGTPREAISAFSDSFMAQISPPPTIKKAVRVQDDDGSEFLRTPPPRKGGKEEQKEKAVFAAAQRFRNKLDVVIIRKLTAAMCMGEEYGSSKLWTSLSKTLQTTKFQPWQGADWGDILVSFDQACAAKALPPNNLEPLFSHVSREFTETDGNTLLAVDGVYKLSCAFSSHDSTRSDGALFGSLCRAAAEIPTFRYTSESGDRVIGALESWYAEAHGEWEEEEAAELKQLLDDAVCVAREGHEIDAML